jgi:hypothetical protein
MTAINPIRVSSSKIPASPDSNGVSRTQAFTRKTGDAMAVTAGKDGARISPAALAWELEALFPAQGRYHFQYLNQNAFIQRSTAGALQISGPGDRVVDVQNGVITDEHVSQGDISGFMAAARNAR